MKTLTSIYQVILVVIFLNIAVFAQFDEAKISKSLDNLKKSNEIEVAVQMIKMDLTDYYPGEITALIKNSYPALPEDRTIRVLPYIREHQITEGKSYERVKQVADKLLRFMSLQERVRLIYFDSEVPVTAFSYPFALIVSNAAAELLSDEELEAVMAHEICHLIIYGNFKAAVDSNDFKQLRTIELFCDAGAIAIIEAKGKDPEKLISGLEKMQEMLVRVNNDTEDGLKHPTLKQRRKFFKELTQKFTVATSRAIN